MFLYLAVLTISSTIGLQAWLTLFNNFAVEVAGLDGNHIGVIQSLREVPGFLALLAVYIIMILEEHRLSALSILVLGLGLALTGLFPSYPGLILTTLVMSFGFHYYETTNMSLTLQYFDEITSPWVFGKQRSYAAASSIVLGLLIYALAFLFSHIYGRRPPPDLYGIFRTADGPKISLFDSGNYHPICYQQHLQLLSEPLDRQEHYPLRGTQGS